MALSVGLAAEVPAARAAAAAARAAAAEAADVDVRRTYCSASCLATEADEKNGQAMIGKERKLT